MVAIEVAGKAFLSKREDCCVATVCLVATQNKRNERREAIVPMRLAVVCTIDGSNHNTHLPQCQRQDSGTTRFGEGE
jgi:hypothetical protein